jgi:hypothetical protein
MATTRSLPPRKLKRPIRRTPGNVLLFLGAGVAAVVLVVAAAAALYITRSAYQASHQASPTAAARGMLYATLHERDQAAVAKYLCNNTIRRRVDKLIDRNVRYLSAHPGSSLTYTWSSVRQLSRHGGTATVTTDVDGDLIQNGQHYPASTQHWTMGLRDQGGWKVCSLSITG